MGLSRDRPLYGRGCCRLSDQLVGSSVGVLMPVGRPREEAGEWGDVGLLQEHECERASGHVAALGGIDECKEVAKAVLAVEEIDRPVAPKQRLLRP